MGMRGLDWIIPTHKYCAARRAKFKGRGIGFPLLYRSKSTHLQDVLLF
jgi:hypothetical protein